MKSIEIPMLPIVIPLGVVIFVVLLSVLRSRGRVTLPRASVAAVLALYAGGVLANTIFPIFIRVGASPNYGPRPLAMYLIPFLDYGLEDALINVAVFIPLGGLIPLLIARPNWWKVTAIAAGASLAIELTQMATARLASSGHLADISDWITNILGGIIGYGLFVLLTRSKTIAGFVQRFRWPARERPVSLKPEAGTAGESTVVPD